MPDQPTGQWNAHWISHSADPREDLGVFGFRRKFDLDAVPSKLEVRVSADQRYKLYVNGEFVGFGPQRGDSDHWFYETYDLAPFLKKGTNWIAALVWNFGRWAPMAQMSSRTGFLLESQPNSQDAIVPNLSTPRDWAAARMENWDFDMLHSEAMNFYIDIGPGEIIDFRGAPWGWRTGEDSGAPSPFSRSEKGEGVGGEGSRTTNGEPPNAPDENERQETKGKGVASIWKSPNSISRAEDRGTMGGGTPWSMVPRSIPPMLYDERKQPPVVRRGFVGDAPDPVELREGSELQADFTLLPDHPYLFDYGELLCAYPRLTLSGPSGTVVTLTYAEGLWRKEGGKGNRNEVKGKKMSGYQDRILLDGEKRTIEPLWWRTYRYLMIEATSPSPEGRGGAGGRQAGAKSLSNPTPPSMEGIVLHHLAAIETGYPLMEESSFTADDPSVKPIWDVSVRTAKRCAGETYFDCPYYEQLQYVGDTRIQALIGYYLGRDRQLTRNAVETLGWSLMENGLTQSRYPTRQTQVIPPFSLWWVMMLWDQLHYDDPSSRPDFISPQTMNRVLGRFRKLQLQEKQFWQFGDWVPNWGWGVPPGGANSLMHQLTLDLATTVAERYKTFLEVGGAKQRDPQFWSSWGTTGWGELSTSSRRRVDDTPSEHGEALNRLHHMMFGLDPEPWPAEALAKANAAKCTYYFSYYKHLAQFGRPEHDESDKSNPTQKSYPFRYLEELKPWKEMLEQGLSTFAENPEPTRSDCHAWSAHPILGFFQIVAGVTSTAPGWKKARIMPHPGSLRRFEANIAHPDGNLQVKFENGKLEIDSPIPFELRWKGKRDERKAGRHGVG